MALVVLKISRQRFHPFKYLAPLHAIRQDGRRLFTKSHVDSIEEAMPPGEGGPHKISAMRSSSTVRDQRHGGHAHQAGPYMTYVVGARVPTR
jgi:hypothetical protein